MKLPTPVSIGARALVAALVALPAAAADAPRPIFPTPFTAERQIVESDAHGETFRSAPVTEYYGGSTLVAVREGQDRTIVDFARREITEVSITKGTYWVLGFGRMRELRERLRKAEAPGDAPAVRAPQAPNPPARIKVEEMRDDRREALGGTTGLAAAPAVRHLRASAEGSRAAVDVWVDGSVRFTPDGLDALRSFESEATGELGPSRAPLADLVLAARQKGDGAFPVRTRRALLTPDGRDSGTVREDVVTRLAPQPFPKKLLELPETLRRVPSPLETMVAFAEDEAALRSKGR
jgi:hypothetical protein